MHPWPPSGVSWDEQFRMSNASLIAAYLRDGASEPEAGLMLEAVRSWVGPTGPNLDYEQMIKVEMAETGLTREELETLWAARQAESGAELARLLALDGEQS